MPAATLSSPLWVLEPYGPVPPSALAGPVRSALARFGDGLLVEEGTTNLVAKPSVEVDTGGWTGIASITNTRDASQAMHGSASLKVTLNAGFASGKNSAEAFAAVADAGLVGAPLSVSCYVYNPLGLPLQLATVGAAALASASSTSKDGWQRLTASGVVAVGSTTLSFRILINQVTIGGEYYWVDALQAEAKAYPTSYADGSLATAWNAVGNLLPTTAQDFEDGATGGWFAAGNCTLANSAAQFYAGTKSLLATATATAVVSAYTSAGGAGPAVTPGKTYTASLWVRASAARSLQPYIRWYKPDGSPSATVISTGAVFTGVAANWVRISVTGVAPSDAGSALLQLNVNDAVAADAFYLDAARIEEGTGSAAFRWNGAENASTSSRTNTLLAHTIPALVPSAVSGVCLARVTSQMLAGATAGVSQIGFQIDDGTANNRLVILYNSGNVQITKTAASVGVSAPVGLALVAGDLLMMAFTFDSVNGLKVYASKNGGAVVTAINASVTVPANLTRVQVGTSGTAWINAPVEQILIYRGVLSAAEITALATQTVEVKYADDPRIVYALATGKVRGTVMASMATGTGHYRPSRPALPSLLEAVAPVGSDPKDDVASYAIHVPAGSGVGQGSLVSHTPDGSGPRYTVRRGFRLAGLHETLWVA